MHNPRCSKSRATLALLQDRGLDVEIVDYLKTPPSPADLAEILRLLGLPARELLRTSEPICAELGLDDDARTEEELLAAMARHPILIQRPIVVANGRAAIGRPPEAVLEIL